MGKCKCKCHCKKYYSKDHEKYNKNLELHLVPVYKENMKVISTSSSNSVSDSIWIIGSTIFWAYGNEGENINIGIIDTGVDSTHPVLQGKIIKRRNYVNDGASEKQFNSHGTHVAGTICANGNNLKGVAPKAKIYDYRVLDRNGSGTYENVTKAIRDSVSDGCHILNLSLGGSSGYQPMHDAIKYAVSKGILIIVAAGNEGPNKVSYPANYPEVISVGAVQYDFPTGTLTTPSTPWFSNTNPEVDVCADGWQVYSCIPDNKYAIYSGTSMASPHVAGFAALVRNKLKEKLKRDPTYSEMYLFMKVSTLNVPSLNKNNLMGAGFVTLYPEFPKKLSNGTWTLPNLSF